MASTLQVDGSITSSDGATITTADNSDNIALVSTDADANSGPNMSFWRNSSSPADNDLLGQINWYAENDASEKTHMAQFYVSAMDVTDGTEDVRFAIQTILGGATENSRVELLPSETVINQDSKDLDFRVESDGNANMLFVDAGNDNIGVGTATPNISQYGSTVNVFSVVNESSAGNYGAIEIAGYRTDDGQVADLNFLNTDGSDGEQARGLIRAYRDGANDALGFQFFVKATGASTAEKMRISSTGAVTAPSTPAFSATPDGTQSNPGNNTKIEFNTEIFDQGANFTNDTFTAPVTGRYQFNVSIRTNGGFDTATDYQGFQLVTSNRSYTTELDPDIFDSAGGFYTFQLSVLADMDASDTAKINHFFNAGTVTLDIVATSTFSGYLAC